MAETGTKPTELLTIKVDYEPREYLGISDKHISDKSYLQERLRPGSVWLCAGKEYSYDERVNYYLLKRMDYKDATV